MPSAEHGGFDLDRFVTAQEPVIANVLAELRAGRKRTHWMWFVFPQLIGLGRSPTAVRYAIASREEAQAYLAHPVLGPRLRFCTELAVAADAPSLDVLFPPPEDRKFCSSMTLFALADRGDAGVFRRALDRWCAGRLDPRTQQLLSAASRRCSG